MQEIVDGSTITTLHTDEAGNTWHIMQREGGSVCLYATRPGAGRHFVHFDSLDGRSPTPAALGVLGELPSVVAAINALLACAPKGGSDTQMSDTQMSDDPFEMTTDVNGKPVPRWQERLQGMYMEYVPFGEILSYVRYLVEERLTSTSAASSIPNAKATRI